MKKRSLFFLLILVLCLIPLVSALAQTGVVTVDALNVRSSANSDSNVVGVVHQGDKVTIKDSTGNWYRISCKGKNGYVYKKYISISSSGSSGSNNSKGSGSSSSGGTCSVGDTGDAVRKVQKRLIALGYLDGSADGSYGNMTKNAVKAFQQKNGLKVTGNVNSTTLSRLNSSDAKKANSSSSSKSSSSSSKGTCQIGDKGDAVRKVQKKLISLGYLSGNADGDYGNMTRNAVKAFQQRNGLSVTGAVNTNTLARLNSSSAKRAVSDSSSGAKGTERLNWFNGGANTIPKGATFKVKDCYTGKVFTCKRWSGYNHLDAEPLNRSATNTMLSIFGHWSWRRRPILVKYNGHVYAASMNGMPHGTSTISNNGFDGHFCIHFYKSKTHESGVVDSEHQNCVEKAMYYSW